MLLTEYDKHQTNTIYIQDSTSACINHNKFVRSLTTSLKFTSKQEQTLHYTVV